MDREAALFRMRESVGLWYVGQSSAADLVYAACDLLVAGLDGPSLRMFAAVSVHHADDDAPSLLEAALRDLGLPYHPKGSLAAHEAGLKVMASRVLSGALRPQDMTAWVHTTFGHDTLELAETFAELDDGYDSLGHIGHSREELDGLVRAEARRILR
jgi:hypothetical protein